MKVKVYLRKDIEQVGMAGEIIEVNDGYARNFLIPRNFAVQITSLNEEFYKKQIKQVEHRKEVITSKTSMLAERIKNINVTLKRKMHDDGKLYGSVHSSEIVDALAKEGVAVSKNQILFDKSIKERGTHEVVVKLSSDLKPSMKLTILPE